MAWGVATPAWPYARTLYSEPLAALGLNILTGYAGQLSLGSAAFMAVGAYAAYNFQLRVEGIPIEPGLAAEMRSWSDRLGVPFPG